MSKRRFWRVFFVIVCPLLVSAPGELWGAGSPLYSGCTIRYPTDATIEWECRRLHARETLETLFADRWPDVARFNRIDRRHASPGVFLKVPKRLKEIAGFTPMPPEYPAATAEAKFILIDLAEQFLGAYEYGRLVLSTPIASGERGNETPTGEFTITAVHRRHRSSLYTIEKTNIPYPMNYALRFHISRSGIAFWIHGRDIPGHPASHGCIGLYDEPMQQQYYGSPRKPVLDDAGILYEWVMGPLADDTRFRKVGDGPRVLIVGRAPVPTRRTR